jgi:hypothetical protein
MANILLSNLPTYTGNTDGVYVVMNDSGNTTTYKVTKEDLIGAFLMRFIKAGLDITNLEIMANEFFDKVGRDKFRIYATVDAEVMREYREFV